MRGRAVARHAASAESADSGSDDNGESEMRIDLSLPYVYVTQNAEEEDVFATRPTKEAATARGAKALFTAENWARVEGGLSGADAASVVR